MTEWQPIETAPKDRLIVGWCVHSADPYIEGKTPDGRTILTTYAAHAEGLGHVPDGIHVLEWGGEYECSEDEGGGYIPDWWFRAGSEWEAVANPILWAPIPTLPTPPETQG